MMPAEGTGWMGQILMGGAHGANKIGVECSY